LIGFRRSRSLALLALLVALALAACQPNPVSSRANPLTMLVWRVQRAFAPEPPEQRCLASLTRRRDALPDAIAGQVDGIGSTDPASVDWEAVFEGAARNAGVRKPEVDTIVVEGDPGVFLVAVDWCYGYSGHDLYVVDLAGDVWPLPAAGSMALPDVRWLGDAWAVVTDYGSGLHLVRVHLIAERDGGWAQIYRSDQPPAGSQPLMWSSPDMPELVFEDGYRLLTVKWIEPGGETMRVLYEWRDGRYVPVEEGKLDDEPGHP
jgi:hypothetical protein